MSDNVIPLKRPEPRREPSVQMFCNTCGAEMELDDGPCKCGGYVWVSEPLVWRGFHKTDIRVAP